MYIDQGTLTILQAIVGGAVLVTAGLKGLVVVRKVAGSWLTKSGAAVQPDENGQWPAVSGDVVGGTGDPRQV